MKNKRLFFRLTILSVCLIFTSYSFGQIQSPPAKFTNVYGRISPICDCKTLLKVSIPNTRIESAEIDPKDGSCRVLAIVNHPPANDSVKVWVALPVENWNGRFEGTGGGGFAGGAQFSLPEPVSQGFAAAATNTGHEGGSGAFALDSGRLNWQLIQDNAYLGIHDMTIVGKALVNSFYGKPAKYAYFVGGSTGGRQGLSEAQRFPDDYNGIVSFFPAINWHRFIVAELWPQVVMNEATNYISAEKFDAFNKAIIDAVDGKDGTLDGIIDDPMHLQFDLKNLIGKKMGESNFTMADADVIKKIWSGPRTSDGKFLWYGLLPGADLKFLAGTKGSPLSGNPFAISTDWTRYFLLSDPKWQGSSITRKEFQLLWNQAVEQYGDVFGTDNPDLTGFRNRGSKVIIIHGLADQLIFPQGSIDYYQRLIHLMGGVKKTMNFARLFLVPGFDHGYSGPKPINYLESVIRWVEENKPPEVINAELRDKSGTLISKRTLFPYSASSSVQAENK